MLKVDKNQYKMEKIMFIKKTKLTLLPYKKILIIVILFILATFKHSYAMERAVTPKGFEYNIKLLCNFYQKGSATLNNEIKLYCDFSLKKVDC